MDLLSKLQKTFSAPAVRDFFCLSFLVFSYIHDSDHCLAQEALFLACQDFYHAFLTRINHF